MKSKYSEHFEIKDVITNKEYDTGDVKPKSTGVNMYLSILWRHVDILPATYWGKLQKARHRRHEI